MTLIVSELSTSFLLSNLMANSLSEECTPLKHEYDSCFNAWFEGYLEPAVTTSSQTRSNYTKRKADEFDTKCGPVWEKYKACVQVRSVIFSPTYISRGAMKLWFISQKAVKERGLDVLLQQAREEHPLAESPPPANDHSGMQRT